MQPLDVFLMSPPRPDWRVHGKSNVFSQAHGSQADAAPPGPAAALREWLALADAITDAPGNVVVLPWADDDASLTGMPYTAEAGFLGRAGAERVVLLPNVKPPHRRGEAARIESWARACGLRTRSIPVLWEGQGDVLKAPSSSGVARFVCTSGQGQHARTSPEAYEHVAPFLPGATIHVHFRAEPWFHGNTFLGFFHGTAGSVAVLCDEALLPGEGERLREFLPDVDFVSITREESLRYATNSLQVMNTVIAPRGVPDSMGALWKDLRLDVVELDMPTLFGKGGGAGVCMTNKLALHVDDIPPALRYATLRPALAEAAARAEAV